MSDFNKTVLLNELPKLNTFLKTHKKKPSQICTHTSLKGGSYHIPDHLLDTFHFIYYNYCLSAPVFPCITEIRKSYSPVLIDLDFKFNPQFNERLISRFHINQILQVFCNHLDDYKYILMQRDEPYLQKKDNIIKDGIHIIFPFTIMNSNEQLQLRNTLIPQLHEIFSDLPLINNIEDVYDRSVPAGDAPWLLYFSSKPTTYPYRVTKSYMSFKGNGLELLDILSLRKNGYDKDPSEIFKLKEDFEPDFSENTPHSIIKIEQDPSTSRAKITKTDHIGPGESTNREIPLDSEEGINICNLIAQVRHNFPQHNLNVTKIKHCGRHIFVGTTDHFCPFVDRDHKRKSASMYIDLSEQGICLRCYDSDCHDQKWPTKHIPIPKDSPVFNMFKDNNITINTFKQQNENSDELLDFQEDNVTVIDDPETNSIVLKSLNGTHYDIAMLIYMLNKDRYRCSSLKKDTRWFEYKEHLWEQDETGIRKFISTELESIYQKVLRVYKTSKFDEYTKKRKVVGDLIKKIKTTTFKNNIMSECSEIFYSIDKHFLRKLNSNTHLIGFNNGIYDLQKKEFRDGTPEDYVSFSVGYIFPTKKLFRREIKQVKRFLKQVFPIKEVRNYVLKLMASCLDGEITEELFHIFTGSGANGKSKFIDLNTKAFGEYGFRLSVALLTQKRASSNSANPELADKMGKRLGIFQEPDKGDGINVGIMKEFTGGDIISVRQLYGQQFEYKPQFSLILCCNDLPKIPSTDGGTWRRMRVIEFVSKFVDNPDPEKPYEFPIDRNLKDKMKEWIPSYMYILLEYYSVYLREGLDPPEEVVKFTRMYQEETHPMFEFVNQFAKITNDNRDYVLVGDLYTAYSTWEQSNNSKIKRSKKEIREMFSQCTNISHKEKNTGPDRKSGWSGVKLISEEPN